LIGAVVKTTGSIFRFKIIFSPLAKLKGAKLELVISKTRFQVLPFPSKNTVDFGFNNL